MQESKFYPLLSPNSFALINVNGTLTNFKAEIFLPKKF